MRIGLASSDWGTTTKDGEEYPVIGGSGWIRCGQYHGASAHSTVLGFLAWDRQDKVFGIHDPFGIDHFDCDVILIQRAMFHDLPDKMLIARANGQIIINDIDDWYWGLSPKNKAFKYTHPKVNPQQNIDHYRRILSASDAVVFSTPYLLERVTWVPNSKKHLHENYIGLDRYTRWNHVENEKPTIGWAGSTAHRSGDLAILKGAFSSVVDEFNFHHTGQHPEYPIFADEVGLPWDKVTVLGLMTIEEYVHYAHQFDIGVIPLQSAPFNMAKSWLKGLEYTAGGIPFIASPLIEYQRLKKLYGVGRHAKNPGEWVKHFRALKSARIREEEAAENLEKIRPLDLSYGAKKWDSLMESLA